MRKDFKVLVTILFFCALPQLKAQEYLEHNGWTKLLSRNVDKDGHVNYKGFVNDSLELNTYLNVLSTNPPKKNWNSNDKLAFWINAYNAFTVQLIIRNYPLKSIKELGGSIYKVNTPWDIKFITIGYQLYDLNNIEHSIIRKEFSEGRIHFAVNCASVSCPPLRNEAYVGNKLDAQLDDQVRIFVNDPSKNDISKDCMKISKIFKWFQGDITSGGLTVIEFINKYSITQVKKKAKISYQDYDWNLNE